MQNGRNDIDAAALQYDKAWAKMMTKIWRDRIDLHRAKSTGYLRSSIRGGMVNESGMEAEFRFTFVSYGLYVEKGVGYGYKMFRKDGKLEFVDDIYRHHHRLDVPRKVGPAWGGGYTSGEMRQGRPWFYPSWSISRNVLADTMTHIIGSHFIGLFDDIEG